METTSAAQIGRPDHKPNRARWRRNSGSTVWLRDFARRHPPMTWRQRISRALHWRLALHPAARSEFLDCRFSNPIPAGPDLSIPNLMLDRLADNLDICGEAAGSVPRP